MVNDTTSTINKTEWVRLNIGGRYFVSTKTTLCKYSNSFFYKLLQDDPSITLTTDKVMSNAIKGIFLNRKVYNLTKIKYCQNLIPY